MIEKKMVEKQEWEDFRSSGLLWFINQTLHLFGWAIVFNVDKETGEVKSVFPAKVKFRGFGEKQNTEGYENLTNHIAENIETLKQDVKE